MIIGGGGGGGGGGGLRGGLPALLWLALLGALVAEDASSAGPELVWEPPARVHYLTSRGAALACLARGDPPPRVTWHSAAGAPLLSAPGVRRVYDNGTLELLPAAGVAQAQVVRCRAAGARGALLSRPVTLQPVEEVPWEARVLVATRTASGGVTLRCAERALAPGGGGGAGPQRRSLARLVRAVAWLRDGVPIPLDAPTPESRYVASGAMLLARAAADARGAFACVARHAVTNRTSRAPPLRLDEVTEAEVATPESADDEEAPVRAPRGATRCLPCAGAGRHLATHYTWYREDMGHLLSVVPSADAWLWADGAALCVRGAGAWRCEAHSARGDTRRRVVLLPDVPLQVTVTPPTVRARAGETVVLSCMSNAKGTTLSWEREGVPMGVAVSTLELRHLSRSHEGFYQCIAETDIDTAQAHADVRLAESPPELVYTFIEQALRAGGDAALRCAARGAPAPALAWLRDALPLDTARLPRYSVSSTTGAQEGTVTSVLNISVVAPADGGRYSCRASNHLGVVEHSARLNIYGSPLVRALPPLRVIAGDNATLHCPYAGYPISSVQWHRGGAALGASGRVAARGATLSLRPALPADAGRYECRVRAAAAEAHRDFEVEVRNPPKISPFMFSSELTEGSTVQVLCSVASGDRPFYFSWFKDGAPLSPDLQIEEKNLNEFSLLMFGSLRARHSGAYTCRVTNRAAAAEFSAELRVRVAPSWNEEPRDTVTLLGAPLRVQCAARGHPVPSLTWHRHTGEPYATDGESGWELVPAELRGPAGELFVSAAARRHAGRYRCTADNGVAPALAKVINVTVYEPAHLDPAESGPGEATVALGGAARLACAARGDEPLTLRWLRRGASLDIASHRWSVVERRSGERALYSELAVSDVSRADAGAYTCRAANAHASADRTLLLHVEEPPEAPRALRLGGLSARWVRVRWHVADAAGVGASGVSSVRYSTEVETLPPIGTPPIALNVTLDLLGDDRSEGGGERELAARVLGLHPGAAYALRLTAHTRAGASPPSAPLLFATLEEAPSQPPRDVRIQTTDFDELHISWSAPVSESWNGQPLGYVVSWEELERAESEVGEERRDGETVGDARRGGTRVSPAEGARGELALCALRPYSRYAVSVRAFNRAGAGPSSPPVHAIVVSTGVPSFALEGIRCESVSAFEVRVLWDLPVRKDLFLSSENDPLEYEILYSPLHSTAAWRGAGAERTWRVPAGGAGGALLRELVAGTNYSVSVRARRRAGAGPRAPPAICATHDDVGGTVSAMRAAALGGGALRVSWLAPTRATRVTHYTLHARDVSAGREWATRVEPIKEATGDAEDGAEVSAILYGLRPRARLELRVRTHTPAGAGAPSDPLLADTDLSVGARVWSVARRVRTAAGAPVRLRCGAAGAPPLLRRWAPLPPSHRITDTGDLVILELQSGWAGNFTCVVRNAAGSDSVTHAVHAVSPPRAPTPRLIRAAWHALSLAWDPPRAPISDNDPDAILGYTVQWELETASDEVGSTGGETRVGAHHSRLALRGLACGARHRVRVRAHCGHSASPYSAPLRVRTQGQLAPPPSGQDLVWANATALRVNLLSWGVGVRAACAPARWSVALRDVTAPPAAWRQLPVTHHCAEAGALSPGAWYELRITAHAPAGDSRALYRAATLTTDGERVGAPARLWSQEAGGGGAQTAHWPLPALALLLSAALAAVLLALLIALLLRRRAAARARGARAVPPPPPPLYSTEPRRAKTLPESPAREMVVEEISPYATFSMSEERWREDAACPGNAACNAPAHRLSRDFILSECGGSESESSGSGCACERVPPARRASPARRAPHASRTPARMRPPRSVAGRDAPAQRASRRLLKRPHTPPTDLYILR